MPAKPRTARKTGQARPERRPPPGPRRHQPRSHPANDPPRPRQHGTTGTRRGGRRPARRTDLTRPVVTARDAPAKATRRPGTAHGRQRSTRPRPAPRPRRRARRQHPQDRPAKARRPVETPPPTRPGPATKATPAKTRQEGEGRAAQGDPQAPSHRPPRSPPARSIAAAASGNRERTPPRAPDRPRSPPEPDAAAGPEASGRGEARDNGRARTRDPHHGSRPLPSPHPRDQAAAPPVHRSWAKLVADPGYAPELLALAAVQTIGPRAKEWARAAPRGLPERHRRRGLARLATKQFTRFGSGRRRLRGGGRLVRSDRSARRRSRLAHAELVLHLAAAYGLDPTDRERAVDLLVLTRVHPTAEDAEAALAGARASPPTEDGGITDAAVAARAGWSHARPAAGRLLRVVEPVVPGHAVCWSRRR